VVTGRNRDILGLGDLTSALTHTALLQPNKVMADFMSVKTAHIIAKDFGDRVAIKFCAGFDQSACRHLKHIKI
jgi:hypothetical protein